MENVNLSLGQLPLRHGLSGFVVNVDNPMGGSGSAPELRGQPQTMQCYKSCFLIVFINIIRQCCESGSLKGFLSTYTVGTQMGITINYPTDKGW